MATDWLLAFADQAAVSDQLRDRETRVVLLATGLYGEAGSVLAELKKSQREGAAYPGYRQRLTEEFGDVLWYFVRLTSELDRGFLNDLPHTLPSAFSTKPVLQESIQFAVSIADVLRHVDKGSEFDSRILLLNAWNSILALSASAGIDLKEAAAGNATKTHGKWPGAYHFAPLLDEECPEEEQIPRALTIEFHERRRGSRVEVLLRHAGITIGDRLTDNISDPDGYRFHDALHFANCVFLGWSPVTRALLRCKRKSKPEVDENQDGARAAAIEEAASALIFSRAKMMRYFEGATQIDYDLLKSIQEVVRGYEVETIPMWQWERGILGGFRVFRQLVAHGGGRVTWDLPLRRLDWFPLASASIQGRL